jgi:hypothetical protein
MIPLPPSSSSDLPGGHLEVTWRSPAHARLTRQLYETTIALDAQGGSACASKESGSPQGRTATG